MKHSGFRIIVSGLVSAAFACAAMAAETTTVAGNVATWVKSSKLTGSASASTSVTVAVHMRATNLAGLKSLVAEVSNPKSKEYGRYITPQQFGQRFEPAGADVAAVKALLEHSGMTNVTQGPHGMYVTATATVSQLRSAFKVTQNLYSYKGRTLRANDNAPTIPASLAGKVLFIEGLDDSATLRQPFHQSEIVGALHAPASVEKSSAPATTPPPVAASNPPEYCNTNYGSSEKIATLTTAADVYGASIPWMNCGYTPQQIQAAYGLNKVRYTGAGVTVAIVDAYASPTLESDANRYAANHGLPRLTSANFSQIIPVGIYDVSPDEPCGPYGWWEEQSLDVAAVHGSAPGAKILFVGSRDCGTSLTVAIMNVMYNGLADVVTNSWGDNGEAIAPGEQQAFDQAAMAGAAEGVTTLFSTGDDGDLSAPNGVASGSWPATSAWVTGVGGTTLETDDNGNKSEYGWGTYRAFLNDVTVKSKTLIEDSGVATVSNFGYTYDDYSFYAGSGGGISLLESQPAYQAGIVPYALATTLNLASTYTEPLPNPMRVSPDVAMVADPYTGYLFGETFTIAGNALADYGCKPISKTEEYCENAIGGTSLASPLMAGVMAVVDQKRRAAGEPEVGFANPWLYSVGSEGNGVGLHDAINQIIAPKEPTALIRSYAANLNEARVVTVNSVPFNIQTAPYGIFTCGIAICEGVDEVFNYTSESTAGGTGPGYNDVTGLGVPWVPKLINEE
ncbi:MAG: S53 family peptidase [Steroidobacteraceae bacterium]|jgi:subtilase family serine protease